MEVQVRIERTKSRVATVRVSHSATAPLSTERRDRTCHSLINSQVNRHWFLPGMSTPCGARSRSLRLERPVCLSDYTNGACSCSQLTQPLAESAGCASRTPSGRRSRFAGLKVRCPNPRRRWELERKAEVSIPHPFRRMSVFKTECSAASVLSKIIALSGSGRIRTCGGVTHTRLATEGFKPLSHASKSIPAWTRTKHLRLGNAEPLPATGTQSLSRVTIPALLHTKQPFSP